MSGSNQSKDPAKLLTPIVIQTHALEKGMSIGESRPGFGKEKAMTLLENLEKYILISGDLNSVADSCSVISKYIEFNKLLGADMSDVEFAFLSFCNKNSIQINKKRGGIYYMSHNDIMESRTSQFDIFSYTRYSIRDFGKTKIDRDAILRALKICEKTPSACNRQRYHIYLYENEDMKNLVFSLQGGSKGFYENMQVAILICGDLRGYGLNERKQVYVDCGLYAMNLLYSLHYEGLATIPLTMGHKQRILQKIKKRLNIPLYEIPVILIGVGSFKENYKVAISERKSYKEYCSFI